MSLDKPKTASVILFIVLASWSIVWSGSKYVFPGLDEKDFLFYLDKQEQAEDHNIYLYSSLSLLSLHKKSIMFDVSKYPSKLVTPLITINIYPDTDIRIQSEFFDFTIWGQLGNFFNRNIEIVKLEKEILDILQKLEEINKRYKELVGSNMTLKIQVEKIITIDKMNFIDSRGENSKEKSDEEKDRPPHAKDNSRKAEPNSMIQMYEREFRDERLRANIHSQTAKAGALEPGSYEAAYVRPLDAPRKVETADYEIDSFIFRLFHKAMAIIRYLKENKIESLIYLSLLLLLSTFIKVLLAR